MNKNTLPIAVIDSGVGGISVLRELIDIMPRENYIYFGDSKNAPYGSKSKSEVLDITRQNLKALQDKGIKALVVACNTATSAAVRILREEHPELVIVGIEPAIKPPAIELDNPTVLVMATPLTLREEKFLKLVERYRDRENVIALPCPRLAELIEGGDLDSGEIEDYIAHLLAPYKEQKIDALVLGCTHYPHVKDKIARHLPPSVKIYDGGQGTARHTKRLLEAAGKLNDGVKRGTVEILNSSADARYIELSKKLLLR
ncbi:MAG: glutamate racemase [Ruminococcaceae bacterium]|nr:glutamate racemase [Oscillospiraceae bacterium]